MPLQVVACVTPNPDEPEAQKEYFSVTMPLLEQVGARIIQKFDMGDAVVGERVAETLMVVEYPSLEALDQVFKSDAYKSIIPARDKAFKTYNVSIIGE